MKTRDLDDRTLVQSLRSCVCPVCGGVKKPAMTMCYRDYKRLPIFMQKSLYCRVGAGYRESVIEALKFLGVEEPKLAAAAPARP